MFNENVKIKRTFMRDKAYDILLEWIITNKLEPGIKLRDQQLSEMLGISRTPVREALLRLEDDGLVVTKANRWTSVAPIDLTKAKNIYSIVETLECLAVEQGLKNIDKNRINEIQTLNDNFKEELEKDNNVGACQIDNEFHYVISQSSNNTELLTLLTNLKVKVQRIQLYYLNQASNINESYKEHQVIISAIKKGDIDIIKESIKSNWKNSLCRLQKSK